jgi:hypothetical protein
MIVEVCHYYFTNVFLAFTLISWFFLEEEADTTMEAAEQSDDDDDDDEEEVSFYILYLIGLAGSRDTWGSKFIRVILRIWVSFERLDPGRKKKYKVKGTSINYVTF